MIWERKGLPLPLQKNGRKLGLVGFITTILKDVPQN